MSRILVDWVFNVSRRKEMRRGHFVRGQLVRCLVKIKVSHHALRHVSGQVVVMCSKTFEKGFAHTEHRSNEVSRIVHNFTMNLQRSISCIFLRMSHKNLGDFAAHIMLIEIGSAIIGAMLGVRMEPDYVGSY